MVSEGLEKFEHFYRKAEENENKTLTVLNKNLVAKVSINLPTKSYTLQLCFYYQVAVVELFNQRNQFTLEESLIATELSVKDLNKYFVL